MMKKTPGLWVSPTEFVSFAESGRRDTKALARQFASRFNSPTFFQNLGAVLPNPDPILKAAGKDIAVYRDLRTEAQVGGNIRRRKGAVKALEWGINKAKSPSRTAKNIEALFADLEIDRIISELLDATLFGYQPLEVMWGQVGAYWLPIDIVGKPPEWFTFNTENELRLRTKTQPVFGEPVPDRKILLPRQDATYDNPYGFADLSMCFWPTAFKKGGLKFWVTFAEKYGSPWVVGKHSRETEAAETDELLARLADMVQDAVAVIPNDSSVEIVESSSKGSSADVYERLLMFCRSEVNYALLGQNQASEASSTNASAQAGLEVTKDIRDADARLVEGTLNTLIRWVCDFNFSDQARPVFSMWEQEEVDKVLAERDEKLVKAGAKLTQVYFKRAYNLQDGDLDESVSVAGAPGAVQGGGVAFAEGATDSFPDQAALDAALAGLNANGQQVQSAQMLAPLIKLVAESSDYPAVLKKLASLYPTIDTSALQESLSRAMFVAELWGQANGDD